VQAEGIVVRLAGTRAYVKIKRSGGCGRCHEVGGCGGVGQDDSHCEEFVVDNSFGAQSGQRVSVEVPEGATLKAAMIAYGLPLLAILLGAGLASWIWHSDLAVALGAATFLVLALLVLYGLQGSGVLRGVRPRITGTLLS